MLIEKFTIVMKSSSVTKKIMHVGLYVPFYIIPSIKRIQAHMVTPSKSPFKEVYLPTLSDIFGIGELVFDHTTYLSATGLVKSEWYKKFAERCEWMGECSWHLQCWIEVYLHLDAMYHMRKEMQRMSEQFKQMPTKKLRREINVLAAIRLSDEPRLSSQHRPILLGQAVELDIRLHRL